MALLFMTSTQKLKKLRALMQTHDVDFYFVPSIDPHHTEYVPKPWQRRAFISGFTGSNGDVLIGSDAAYLWTDGRYTLQAKLQIDAREFTLFPYEHGQNSTLINFLKTHAQGKRVGVDPTILSCFQADQWIKIFTGIQAKLVFIQNNLIDQIWQDRPSFEHAPAMVYPLEFAGVDSADKLKALRTFMQANNLDFIALNELTSIAWLFNIRGHDLAYTPIVLSYALISQTKAQLYIDPHSWTPAFSEYCKNKNFTLLPYAQFYEDLAQIRETTVALDQQANALMQEILKQHHNRCRILTLPLELAKACKNPVELQGMIKAHIEDALALCRFFAWLDQNWQGQTEISISEKLYEFRRQSALFYSPSFPTIAGFKEHGAIVHYFATPETSATIKDDGLFLIDSGGQYLGGTTDVTRTIHLGAPTPFEKTCYTLVLKGHLALRHTPFPKGTRGDQLDSLARQYLWHHGYNYMHGTGHGVGSFLNVHEGPQRISTGISNATLVPNMVLSNEPGVYFEGQFGIRLENVCYVKPAELANATDAPFYILEDLTLVPYCLKLIDVAQLNQEEILWINEYHQKILTTLAPYLDESTKLWLTEATKELDPMV
jgi:Xaa-Pro aminopeptidase